MHNHNFTVVVEDLSPVKKKLNVTVPAAEVKKAVDETYRSLKNEVSIAGFRKGAIPMNILRSRFAEHVREDVTKKIVESSYPHVLHEQQFTPIAPPQIELVSPKFDESGDLSYSATVEITPAVAIDGYKGMDLEWRSIDVTERDLDEAMERLRVSRSTYKEVERPADAGDLVVVDFDSSLDGKPIKDGKGKDFNVIIGEMTPLPGFDDALKGASKGETRNADITFPANISKKELAGRAAQFIITVKSVKAKYMPEIDDEMAKDLGMESLAALKERVRVDMINSKDVEEKERLKNVILDRLIEGHPFEVPETLVNRYQAIILNKVAEGMSKGSIAPEDQGLSVDELKAKYRVQAERHVREDIVLDTIAAAEDIQVSEEELNESVKGLAASRGVSFDALMKRIEQEGALEVVRDGIKHEKVFDLIFEASKTAE